MIYSYNNSTQDYMVSYGSKKDSILIDEENIWLKQLLN